MVIDEITETREEIAVESLLRKSRKGIRISINLFENCPSVHCAAFYGFTYACRWAQLALVWANTVVP
jgi:hypothetical protein